MSTVANLNWKYKAFSPSGYFDDQSIDNKLYAADVDDVRFAVFIPATASDTWPKTKGNLRSISAFCCMGRVWAVENFDIRSRPDIELSYLADGIVSKGVQVSNPDHIMIALINELPPLVHLEVAA